MQYAFVMTTLKWGFLSDLSDYYQVIFSGHLNTILHLLTAIKHLK